MVACEHTTWCKIRRTGRTTNETPFSILICFVFLALWALPASAAQVMVTWGCPTTEGPVAIAEAFASDAYETVGMVARDHKCSPFPYPVEVKAVRFASTVTDGSGPLFIWEVSFEGGASTFFTSFGSFYHDELERQLGRKI